MIIIMSFLAKSGKGSYDAVGRIRRIIPDSPDSQCLVNERLLAWGEKEE